MADEQNKSAEQRASDYKEYRAKTKKYKQARKEQEILEETIKHHAQEKQAAHGKKSARNTQGKHDKNNDPITQEIREKIKAGEACQFNPETKEITINNKYCPELDPKSPQFDETLYNSYAAAINEQLKETITGLKAEADKCAAEILSAETVKELASTIETTIAPLMENMRNALMRVVDVDGSISSSISDAVKYIIDNYEGMSERLQEWEAMQPYLEEELKKPEYCGYTLSELLEKDFKDKAENDKADNLLNKAIEAARATMLSKQLPNITVNSKIASVDYPLDKVNSNIWKLLQEGDKTGQMTFAVERRGSKRAADVIYSLDFEALEQETGVTITKKLTAFDKRVYIATGALFNNGLEVTTIAQIYAAMGNTGRPSANDINKINNSLTKMQAAHIFLNNISEHQLYNKYDEFVYDASLLPMERVRAVINGQTVDSAIHLFREPPLITFARKRKQITTISRKLLESPLSKTDANLLIDDYLLERISHMKNKRSKLSNKLLYTTIYDKCHITTKMQRSRAKEKIIKYLDHYKKCKFIKDYKEEADGIKIVF